MPSIDSGLSPEIAAQPDLGKAVEPSLAGGLMAPAAGMGGQLGVDPKNAPIGDLGQPDMGSSMALPTGVAQQTSVASLGQGGGHQVHGDFAAPSVTPGAMDAEAGLAGAPKRTELLPIKDSEFQGLGAKPQEEMSLHGQGPAKDAGVPKPAAHSLKGHEDHHAAPAMTKSHGPNPVTQETARAHEPGVTKDGPANKIDRGPGKDGPERKVEPGSQAPGGGDSATREAIKEAKHDGSLLGPMKQHILDNPMMVAGAIGAAVAAMGGGWKWSLLAVGAAYLGTKGYSQFSDNSKKAEGFDKIAKLQGEAGPKKA